MNKEFRVVRAVIIITSCLLFMFCLTGIIVGPVIFGVGEIGKIIAILAEPFLVAILFLLIGIALKII